MKYRACDYLPLPEVASTLGCSRQTVYRLIECGELEGIQLRDHGWWRVLGRSLDRYISWRIGKRPAALRAPAAANAKRLASKRKKSSRTTR